MALHQELSLFLLSIRIDELISALKVMTFFPVLKSVNKNFEQESNPIRSHYICIFLNQYS